MAIDWDGTVLGPVMGVFGEGTPDGDPESWPLYTPRQGPAFRLADAVFDREFREIVLQGDGSEISSRKPVMGVRLALFPSEPLQRDQVYVPSIDMTFTVSEVQPDGHGHALLILKRSSR